MQGSVVISHRAQRFALGRGEDFFGVWQVRANELVLVERWPRTAAGWYRAWARFNELEASPEAPIVPDAAAAASGRFPPAALVLLVAGIVLGVVSLFPSYLGGVALTGTPDQLVEHVLFIAGWTSVVVMSLLGDATRRVAGVFGLGLSAMAFGFYLSDLGEVISSGGHLAGAGLVLGLLGWLLCAQGSAAAAISVLRKDRPLGARARRRPFLVAAAAVLGIGLAASFAPAWDSYHLYAAATGQTTSLTAGNAFANPASVIAANVVIMVLMVVLAVFAVLFEDMLLGAALLAGALVALGSQVVSAIVQLGTPPGPSSFGIGSSQAAQAQLQISAGLTPVFYVYCVFGVALLVLCVEMARHARSEARGLQAIGAIPFAQEMVR